MFEVFAFWGCFWLIVLGAIYVCSRFVRSKALLMCGLGFLVVFCLASMSPAWILASVLLFAVAIDWPKPPVRAGQLTLVCGGIVAVASGFVIAGALHRLHELDTWRQEFAFESMVERLQYERTAARRAAGGAVVAPAPLEPEIAHRLTRFEEESYEGSRVSMLRRLHNDTRAEFEVLTGFGPIRMRQLHRRYLELPPSRPVPQPADAPWEFDERWTSLETLPIPELPQDKLLALHDAGLSDFLEAERMGYIEDREHVAGFDSHRFTQVPELSASEGADRWDVQRLELIGLLSHDRPVVYVTEHLPDLEELGDAAVREPDEFERGGLDELRSERDIVVAEHATQIRMLGAVRASQSCLECHQVQRGELLGAFSYVIAPPGASVKAETIAAATPGE